MESPMTPERADQFCRMVAFIQSLLDPERLGHAVTDEVRQKARAVLPQPRLFQPLPEGEPE